MIAYTMLGTNDLDRAGAFYDALLAPLGARRLAEGGGKIGWGRDASQPLFFVTTPFDGQKATAGNGTMIALGLQDPAQIDETHARALALGATDEGAPGPRMGGRFHCAYFRDLDGNKLNLWCMR